jgi:hypothetical protein
METEELRSKIAKLLTIKTPHGEIYEQLKEQYPMKYPSMMNHIRVCIRDALKHCKEYGEAIKNAHAESLLVDLDYLYNKQVLSGNYEGAAKIIDRKMKLCALGTDNSAVNMNVDFVADYAKNNAISTP